MTSILPLQQLNAGVSILLASLQPAGFTFHLRETGKGSGGNFAWGEFVRLDRRLELHFRHSLGQVQYHVGEHSVRHEPYMRELGVWSDCRYPGFSDEPLQVFRDLEHDLKFAEEFLVGSATILMSAAAKQEIHADAKRELEMARYLGQRRKIAEMRSLFKLGKYAEVLAIFETLPAPQLLSDAERRLIDISRRRGA